MKKFFNYIIWWSLFWFLKIILNILSKIMNKKFLNSVIFYSLIWFVWLIVNIIFQMIFFASWWTSYWIDYSNVQILDIKQKDKIQILYTIRKSKIDTVGTYITNTFCNWKTNLKWNTVNSWIILNKTDWYKIIISELNLSYKLPVGHCKTNIFMDIEVWHDFFWNSYSRHLFFSSEFEVYKNTK